MIFISCYQYYKSIFLLGNDLSKIIIIDDWSIILIVNIHSYFLYSFSAVNIYFLLPLVVFLFFMFYNYKFTMHIILAYRVRHLFFNLSSFYSTWPYFIVYHSCKHTLYYSYNLHTIFITLVFTSSFTSWLGLLLFIQHQQIISLSYWLVHRVIIIINSLLWFIYAYNQYFVLVNVNESSSIFYVTVVLFRVPVLCSLK